MEKYLDLILNKNFLVIYANNILILFYLFEI